MTIFAPPFTKKSPAARLKMRLPPAVTLVVGAARPESATRLVSIIPVSHEGVSLTRDRMCENQPNYTSQGCGLRRVCRASKAGERAAPLVSPRSFSLLVTCILPFIPTNCVDALVRIEFGKTTF